MIAAADIVSIAQNILSTMLDLESSLAEQPQTVQATDRVTGCIQINGEWQGAVVIQSSEELARLFAGRLLELNAKEVTEIDLLDSFAEMTNMIGGNIKGQVPCPSFLSLPFVTTGNDFNFHMVGAKLIHDLSLECESESLRIMMCEAGPQGRNPFGRS